MQLSANAATNGKSECGAKAACPYQKHSSGKKMRTSGRAKLKSQQIAGAYR